MAIPGGQQLCHAFGLSNLWARRQGGVYLAIVISLHCWDHMVYWAVFISPAHDSVKTLVLYTDIDVSSACEPEDALFSLATSNSPYHVHCLKVGVIQPS